MKPTFPTALYAWAQTLTAWRRWAGLVALLPAAVGLAQTGSAPVGVMSYAVGENATISLGVPLLRPAVFGGSVTAVSGPTLTISGPAAASAVALVAGESYYLEVIGHVDGVTTALVGQRCELDEAATLAGPVGRLILDPNSPHNTSAITALAGLTNYRVVVRPHWTLAALLGTGVKAKVNAAASAATADQVLAWNGTGFSVYFVRAGDSPQWRNIATGATNQDGAILPPGSGLFLRRQSGALAFSVPGEVRMNTFVRPPFTASQIVAAGFPIDATPAEIKLAAGPGLTPGSSPANADQVLAWANNAFSIFYLREGPVPQWRNTSTGLLDYTFSAIFPARGANLLLLRTPATATAPVGSAQLMPFSF